MRAVFIARENGFIVVRGTVAHSVVAHMWKSPLTCVKHNCLFFF